MTPKEITVLIEGDDTETKAKLISFSEVYQASLYETDDGREFYVDPEHIRSCQEESKPVGIPLAVITQREKMLAKLAWGQDQLDRLSAQDNTGIIVPDGFKA